MSPPSNPPHRSYCPYLLRAMYEWCTESGYTPHISVRIDERTQVPRAYAKDGMIVFNIGPSAVRDLHIDNERVAFSARFGGVAQEVFVPVDNVIAVYARETGEGIVLRPLPQTPTETAATTITPPASASDEGPTTPPPRPKGRPILRVVK